MLSLGYVIKFASNFFIIFKIMPWDNVCEMNRQIGEKMFADSTPRGQ
jgi:hypothetical protein